GQKNLSVVRLFGVKVHNLGTDISPSNLTDQQSRPFKGIFDHIDVDPPFEPKGCIRIETMALGGLSDGYRIEVGTFQKNGGSMPGHPGMDAPEHPGNAHRAFGVANHKVFPMQLSVHLVQGPELGAGGQGLDLYLVALYL